MADFFIDVKDSPYNASGNGIIDDTNSIQQALDNAGNFGGGIVLLPAGTYKILGTLSIPPYVTLQGVFTSPAVYVPNKGTILLAYSGRGNSSGVPFISLAGFNSSIVGLSIVYPEQNDPLNIIPYPWTIRGGSPKVNCDNLSIQNVLLLNPYLGVDFGTFQCGRHLIRGLYGQPLQIGILIDQCYDVGRIEDVHFWPFWNETALTSFISNNGFALVLKRSDWQIVHNFFAFGYHVGVHFAKGAGNHGTNGQFTNLNFDQTDVGLDIYAIQEPGINISNLNIVGGTGKYNQKICRAIWAHDSEDETGPLSIQNGSFWGIFNDEVILWQKEGALLQIASSVFRDWRKGGPAIKITKGRATIQGNLFKDLLGISVDIGLSADRVIVIGNQLAGNPIKTHGRNNERLIWPNL